MKEVGGHVRCIEVLMTRVVVHKERALRESLQTDLDRARLALAESDSGQYGKPDHAARLMAELEKQQRMQEEKDRQSQVSGNITLLL